MENNHSIEVPSLYSFSTNEEDYFVAGDSRRTTERLDLTSSLLVDKSKGFIRFKNDHYCKFNWSYFCEFFFYHFMFYFVLGPLFPLVFLPIIGIPLMKNMGFWGFGSTLISQLFIWLLIFSMTLILIIGPEWNRGQSVVTLIDIYTVITLVLLRISNISSKYATFTPEKMAYLRHNIASSKEMYWDLLLGDWLKQTDEKILDEIESAVKRNEIDLNLLMVFFLRPPDSATLERLMKKNICFRKRNKTMFQKDPEKGERAYSMTTPMHDDGKEAEDSIFGVAIIHDLLERFRDNKIFRNMVIICAIISIIRGAIPWLTYRFSTSLNCWQMWAISIFISVQITYIYFQITIFFAIANIDIKRKIFIETQLGYLITPRKYGGVEGDKKIFPTTNFLCPRHLRGWNLLRKIGRDYGFKYALREANNLGSAAALYLFFAVILVLIFFGIIDISFFVPDPNTYRTLEIVISFDVIIFFILLMRELILGLKLNNFYKIHKNNFEEMQIYISDIARKTDWYFVKNLTPKNYLYSFTVDYFKVACKSNQSDSVSKRLEDLLATMKEINRDLQFEESHRPFTVLGFEPSSNLLRTIAIGVASLTFAIVQYYMRHI